MTTTKDRTIDAAIGRQIRVARIAAGITQEQLAEKLEISYQQVQKYEAGRDSLRASLLPLLSVILQRPVSALLDAADGDTMPDKASEIAEAMMLGRVLQSIPDPRVRRKILAVAEALAKAAPGAPIEASPPAHAAE